MKNSALYSKELRRFAGRLKRSGAKPTAHVADDPLEHLILAVLSQNNSPSRARAALAQLLDHVVDYNDLRVSTPEELARIIAPHLPNSLETCVLLIRVLNAVYDEENEVSLSHLKSKNKKDVRTYLERLDGMTSYVLTSTMLWGFGDYGVPIDQQILNTLKREELVDPDTTIEAAQSFCRRHVPAAEGRTFAALLKRYAAQKQARAVAAPTSRRSARKKTTSR